MVLRIEPRALCIPGSTHWTTPEPIISKFYGRRPGYCTHISEKSSKASDILLCPHCWHPVIFLPLSPPTWKVLVTESGATNLGRKGTEQERQMEGRGERGGGRAVIWRQTYCRRKEHLEKDKEGSTLVKEKGRVLCVCVICCCLFLSSGKKKQFHKCLVTGFITYKYWMLAWLFFFFIVLCWWGLNPEPHKR